MIKRLLLLSALLVVFTSTGFSQWTLQSVFPTPDTLKGNTGGHGVAVAADGNIWITPYKPFAADSVFVPDSNKYKPTKPIFVFKPDGTPVSFSPIKAYVVGATVLPLSSSAYTGITRDEVGNLIIVQGYEVFKFDYKTGLGLGHYSDVAGLTKPAVDQDGNIYVAHTLGDLPIKILNPDLTFNTNAVDTLKEIGRTIDVSKDGNTIYAHRYTALCTFVYKRATAFDPYILTDTLFKGWQIEGSNFNPVNGLLYVSAGSFNNKPTDPSVTPGTYYGVDVNSKKVLDSLKWTFNTPGNPDERNRGIAFSNDGKTAYITAFGQSNYAIVQKLTTSQLVMDVKKDESVVVNKYALSQNYPNPFNPSTEIKFAVAKDGMVSLKVYDLLGKEVASLVNGDMKAGGYTVTFDASKLATGMYIYQLTSGGTTLSHKMMLLK